MAPTKSRNINLKSREQSAFLKFYNKYINYEFAKSLVFDPSRLPIVSAAIIITELVLNVVVVQKVPYTEIDWIAYMQECEGFLNGTTNYALLRGDTGPLVYPAGFVYIYSALYYITSRGQNVRLAQYVFIVIYLLQMFLVLRLYTKSRKVPPYVLVLSAFTSYRIHSIYVLRLFNDPIAVLFSYAAFNFFLDRRWTLGSIFFSLGVSVKMNILLYAPAIFLFYLTSLGYKETFKQLSVCAVVQLILGSPFLLTYPVEYIKGSFDIGRVFEHKWTVHYRFLDKDFFENRIFHLSLLLAHVALLLIFASPAYRFFQSYNRLRILEKQLQPQIDRENARLKAERKAKKAAKVKKMNDEAETLTKEQEQFLKAFEKSMQKTTGLSKPLKPEDKEEKKVDRPPDKYSIFFDKAVQLALLPIFLCNFVGIACARSLHYQFYVWYFHSLPYLVFSTDFSLGLRFLILGLIEFCWNTYPSTNVSSVLLHCCHIVLLFGVGRRIFKSKTDSEKVK